MDGTAIFVVALLMLLCVVGILYTISQLIELEAMPARRQVERTIIPADWDRIMKETQLEKEERQEMTHEEFKDICLKEFPLIEGMVKTVKALGVKKVSCYVWEDGHISFDITTQDNFFTACHVNTAEKGSLIITAYDIKRDLERGMHFENAKYLPECFYETSASDETLDDIPVQ